ncbi:unnamed protein product [Brassicogethes aeneus]|uniref:Uncharacterized protein n=1 Tax=Brassicogethes aeneus TaxID=1431903 RepID=A0A9P0ASR0_BRAAE|nr:unnamed protein product [Brassicogethes aeneus]
MRSLPYFAILLLCVQNLTAQVYIPAQILIPPTHNWTHPNHWNNTPNSNNPGWLPNHGNNSRPGWNPPNSNYGWNNRTNITNSTQDGHLFVGNIQFMDRLLYNQVFYKPSRWWTSREKIIEYPKDLPAGYARHDTINAIRIYNQFVDGNTARALILSGGIGRQYVKIRLQSNWGKGFKYLVQIYGH